MKEWEKEFWSLLLMGGVAGALLSAAITVEVMNMPKKKCEAELPRNVECVWAPPTSSPPA